jgi:hypothetical protein
VLYESEIPLSANNEISNTAIDTLTWGVPQGEHWLSVTRNSSDIYRKRK